MRLSTLLAPDLRATLADDPEALQKALSALHPEDVAEIIEDFEDEEAVVVLGALDADSAAEVFGRLTPERQDAVIAGSAPERMAAVFSAMAPDDRVDVLQRMPEEQSQQLIALIARDEPDVAEETRELGAYPEDSAGGLMTTEYVALSPGTKVWEAIEAVRRLSREEQTETVYYIYVCGYGRKLLGVLSLRDLILADPGQALADVMVTQVVRVAPTDDQEKVADTIARYDLSAIPVIDSRGRMLGVVTIDDVVDVVIEEATEDAHMMGGVVPLEGSYFSTGVIEFVWKRAFWLIVLFFGQLLTATVMEGNQRILQHTLDLVIFVPLIIASGGNAGSQSSSLIIRALAIGEMQPGDWLRVLRRETSIGLALGLLLGVIGYGRAFFAGTAVDPAAIALAVGGSIVAVVVLGTLVGSLLPVLIQRLGFDPAVSSTPFIASLVDVLGLLVYFRIAAWVLTLL